MSSKKELIKLEIVNLRKYQTRPDIKSMNYIRIKTRIFEDPEFQILSVQGKLLWFVILGLAASDNNPIVTLNPRYIAVKHGLQARWIRVSVSKYEQFGWVRTLSRNESGPKEKRSKEKRSKVKDIPNGISATPENAEKKSGAEIIFQLYNIHRGELAIAKTLSKARREKANLRWKENPDRCYWTTVFQKAGTSSFLTGKTERGWKANFDWLIKNEENSLKVFEGAYERGQKQSAKNQATIDALNERYANEDRIQDVSPTI